MKRGEKLKKKAWLAVICMTVIFLLSFAQSKSVLGAEKPDDNGVVVTDATTDVDTLYERYQDNSFELMTKDMESTSFTGIKETFVNATSVLKNIIWGAVKTLGQFNVSMVKYLFSMDIITAIKKPFVNLMSSIAGNMTNLAGVIGIAFISLIMVVKYVSTQRIIQSLKIFGMTILIFTGLAISRDAGSANSFFDTLFDIDKTVENEFVKINPVLGENSVQTSGSIKDKNGNEITQELSAAERFTSTGEMIGSRIFYTNVYEPYLLMNYGTTDIASIREKKVEYEGGEYDRINILLDNDVNKEGNEKLHTEVTNYESEELDNRSIQYYSNMPNFFYGLFYLVVNLIQTIVYFILCFLRLVIAVIQVFLLPIFPILLFTGLFMTESNVFVNYFKGFGFTILMKGSIGFLCIFFATFLSLGFQLSNAVVDPWQKILTIIIYLLTPLGIYMFRSFLWGMVTGKVKLSDAASFMVRPFSTERMMRTASKERKLENRERRKQAQEDRKAARKKRQEEAKKNGKPELGLKEKAFNKNGSKQSELRRERQPKPQHKAPNSVEKANNKLQGLHEKGRQDEVKEQQQAIRQRQRKAYDKENNQTARALQKANGELGTTRQLNQRRTGQSNSQTTKTPTRSVRRQGQKGPIQSKEMNQRRTGAGRSQRREQGQKPQTVTPIQTTSRRIGSSGSGGSPRRSSIAVQRKMNAVNQITSRTKQQTVVDNEEIIPRVKPQVTRMSRKGKSSKPKGVNRVRARK